MLIALKNSLQKNTQLAHNFRTAPKRSTFVDCIPKKICHLAFKISDSVLTSVRKNVSFFWLEYMTQRDITLRLYSVKSPV